MTVLTGFDAGDTATLRLTVTPEGVPTDATTTASVELLDPAGTTRTPTATPNADRSEWTATLDALLAGEYVGRWTVVGTGAGVEPVTVLVGPAPTTAPTGRSYATTGDFAVYLGAAPAAGARRLLARATGRVDELLRASVYDVDTDGMPTDTTVIAALRDAACAQAAWFDEAGDLTGAGVSEQWSSVRIGNVTLGGDGSSKSSGGRPVFAPDAVRALYAAGLLPGRARVWPYGPAPA